MYQNTPYRNTYHLNNVQPERISIQSWKNNLGEQWIIVDLHGDNTVWEQTVPGFSYSYGKEEQRYWRKNSPEVFQPQHFAYNEAKLKLDTMEQDRVTRRLIPLSQVALNMVWRPE
jgi:hypothetical protein